jgi:iron transport multicopper oxidase
MNDGQDATYPVVAGKTYLFRIVNMAAFPSFYFNIAGHNFQIVEMDGVYTTPTTASTLYIGAAQRYTILVTAKTGVTSNFDISALVDTSMFRAAFNGDPVAHGIFQYSSRGAKPAPRSSSDLLSSIMPPVDDANISPLDRAALLAPVNKQIIMDFEFGDINAIPRSVFIDQTKRRALIYISIEL